MKKLLSTLATIVLLFIMGTAGLCASTPQRVFVIPVETEIDNSAVRNFRRGLDKAVEDNSTLIVLRLNTFGGALDAADSIRTALIRTELPTVAFVDVNAASAGALIALACDSVYMAPAASMGSATVVNGSGEPMPEKYQSYMSTIMRATAEHHGMYLRGDSMVWRRDPAIAASMVNPEESVSLTARQALECGYSDGTAAGINDVLADLGMADAEVRYYKSSFADDLLGFLSNAAVRAILIMLILGGIYMEMHTPGLGFAASVATVATVLYFMPMFIGGSIPAWVLIALIAGVVLIALEVFVVPGFGICGISGIIAIAGALTGAMTANDAVTGFDLGAVGRSLAIVAAGGVMAVAVVGYLTSARGPECFRRHSELMTELSVADGFVGVDMSPAKYIGSTATAVTVLRPAGKIEIGKNIFDAVSTGEFIAAGKEVRVTKYENAQLYVEEVKHA